MGIIDEETIDPLTPFSTPSPVREEEVCIHEESCFIGVPVCGDPDGMNKENSRSHGDRLLAEVKANNENDGLGGRNTFTDNNSAEDFTLFGRNEALILGPVVVFVTLIVLFPLEGALLPVVGAAVTYVAIKYRGRIFLTPQYAKDWILDGDDEKIFIFDARKRRVLRLTAAVMVVFLLLLGGNIYETLGLFYMAMATCVLAGLRSRRDAQQGGNVEDCVVTSKRSEHQGKIKKELFSPNERRALFLLAFTIIAVALLPFVLLWEPYISTDKEEITASSSVGVGEASSRYVAAYAMTSTASNGGRLRALTVPNFRPFLEDNEHVFVLFGAEWCSHSQKLRPTWYEFAAEIQARKLPMAVAAVDCTAEKELCRAEHIAAFPTLRWYRDGMVLMPHYTEERTVKAFVEFAKKNVAAAEEASSVGPCFDKPNWNEDSGEDDWGGEEEDWNEEEEDWGKEEDEDEEEVSEEADW